MPALGWMNRAATFVHILSTLLALAVLRTDASPGKPTAGASNLRFDRQQKSEVHQVLLEVLGDRSLVESGAGALIAVERCIENSCWAVFLDRRVCRAAAGSKKGCTRSG